MRMRSIVVMVMAATIGFLAGRDARAQVTVSLNPALVALQPREQTLVQVAVEGVPAAGLAAFQITLHYDPRHIRVLDPNAAHAGQGVSAFAPLGNSPLCAAVRGGECTDSPWLLTATGRTVVGVTKRDAGKGDLTIAYGSAGSQPLPAGGGTLALLEVVGVSGEPARIEVKEFIAADGAEPPQTYPWRGR
jgi:hypothetical protein